MVTLTALLEGGFRVLATTASPHGSNVGAKDNLIDHMVGKVVILSCQQLRGE